MTEGARGAPGGRRGEDPTSLLERERDLDQVESLLQQALGGVGSAVLIEGPAGIGKTQLLSRARELAAGRGFETLTARGGELERDLPFVVVRELFGRRIAAADKAERKSLLSGAAALAEQVIGSADGDSANLSAVLHGLFWVCSNLADRRPLLIVVDDAHWADPGSLRFLSYLAHRIVDLPVVLVVASRIQEPEADAGAVAAIRRDPACTVIEVQPLSPSAVADVLRANYSEPVAEEFAHACHATTRGNPFLVRELVLRLREEGLGPNAEDAERVETVRTPRIADQVRARLGQLPAAAIELARAVAVLGTRVELRHAAKLVGIDDRVAEDAADALAAANLFEPRRPLTFLHPIIRSAVYEDLPAGRRSTAHGRAARLLADEGAPVDNVASHLLHTEPTGDDQATAILQEAAEIAVNRGAPEQAVSYLRRALAESPPHADRVGVLRRLGAAETAAGEQGVAAEHLLEALSLSDACEHDQIAEQASVALIAAGRHNDAVAVLDKAVSEATDEEGALRLDAAMLGAALLTGAPYPRQHELIARLLHTPGKTPAERLLLANGSYYLMLNDGASNEALEFARRALAGANLLKEAGIEAPAFWLAALPLIGAEQHDELRDHLDAAQQEAAKAGSIIGLALVLHYRAMSEYQRGMVAAAVEDEQEALRICERVSWLGGINYVLGILTRGLAERGDLIGAENVLRENEAGMELPQDMGFEAILIARADLLLAQGHPADAFQAALQVGRLQEQRGQRTAYLFWGWRALAVRALVSLGDLDEARRLADEQLAIARRWGTPGPIAGGLRSRALTEEGAARTDLLTQARVAVDGTDENFEKMHVLLELGMALRHQRRHSESREPLLEALDLAERGGVALLAERARAELAATGLTRSKRTFLTGVEALTPSELRVATMAAEGMSNPEIAQSLFVTRKTVEKHLANAYTKLEIRSREELPQALG